MKSRVAPRCNDDDLRGQREREALARLLARTVSAARRYFGSVGAAKKQVGLPPRAALPRSRRRP